jgi:hypothetical protein
MSAIVIPECNYIHVAEPDGSVKLVSEPGTYHLKFGEQLVFKPRMMHIVSPFFIRFCGPLSFTLPPLHPSVHRIMKGGPRTIRDNQESL